MHIFIDESGKPEVYSARGTDLVTAGTATKYLVLAAVKAPDQLFLQRKITKFKSELLEDDNLRETFSAAYALDAFHAANDYKSVRERFYKFISELPSVEIHAIVAEKLSCKENLKKHPSKMYGLLAGLMLQNICHQDPANEIIFSRQDNGKKVKEELELEVERITNVMWKGHKNPPQGIQLRYQHNPHYSHGGLQVADYVAYAVFQHFEKANSEYLKLVKKNIRHIYNYSTKEHFTRSKPLELS